MLKHWIHRLLASRRVPEPVEDAEAQYDWIRRHALDPAHYDRFAALLGEILPTYSDWAWGVDSPHRRHFLEWQRRGFSLLPNHFYSPVPDVDEVSESLSLTSGLPGLELRRNEQRAWVESVCTRYEKEYSRFPEGPTGQATEFHFGNGAFERVDAEVLHCMIRSERPTRMIEIGSGHSTLIAAAACRLNASEGHPCEFVAVEPYPNPVLLAGVDGLSKLVDAPLREVDTEYFAALGRGDILFIDSSHVLKTGSDVSQIYLEVLPTLAPGTIVHIHDIFLPDQYPRSWLEQEHVFWNEQYLLQAFLAFNQAFEILFAGGLLHREQPELLRKHFPGYDPARHLPGSFWMRRAS